MNPSERTERDRRAAARLATNEEKAAEYRRETQEIEAACAAHREAFRAAGWVHECRVCGTKYTPETLEALPVVPSERESEIFYPRACTCGHSLVCVREGAVLFGGQKP